MGLSQSATLHCVPKAQGMLSEDCAACNLSTSFCFFVFVVVFEKKTQYLFKHNYLHVANHLEYNYDSLK